jgi:hypothetical protein
MGVGRWRRRTKRRGRGKPARGQGYGSCWSLLNPASNFKKLVLFFILKEGKENKIYASGPFIVEEEFHFHVAKALAILHEYDTAHASFNPWLLA